MIPFLRRLFLGEASTITHSAGGVVVGPTGKVLIVSQPGQTWSLPKGHLEEGEDALSAARREIDEETGVSELEFIRELGTYSRYKIAKNGGNDWRELKNITLFLFRTHQEKLSPKDPKNPQAIWVDKADVASRLTHPKDKAFFMQIVPQL